MDFLTEYFGYLAIALVILQFQFNNRNKIQYTKMGASLSLFFHYLLLGATVGAIMNILGILRTYLYIKYEGNKKILVAFLIIFPISVLITSEGLISIFPLIGMIAGTIAFWMSNPKYIRLISLICNPAWIIYALFIGSHQGVINESILLMSVLIGIYRFDIKKEKQDSVNEIKSIDKSCQP